MKIDDNEIWLDAFTGEEKDPHDMDKVPIDIEAIKQLVAKALKRSGEEEQLTQGSVA